jgi:hypothetical protein
MAINNPQHPRMHALARAEGLARGRAGEVMGTTTHSLKLLATITVAGLVVCRLSGLRAVFAKPG